MLILGIGLGLLIAFFLSYVLFENAIYKLFGGRSKRSNFKKSDED